MLDYIRKAPSFLMETVSVFANIVFLFIVLWALNRSYGMTIDFINNAGGMPPLSLDIWMAMIYAPDFHWRLVWWFAAWISAVFSAGLALMAIAGIRWAWLKLTDLSYRI